MFFIHFSLPIHCDHALSTPGYVYVDLKTLQLLCHYLDLKVNKEAYTK